ncbi:hypothetical protein [Pseudomonas putida]|uniref:hypothetical protein n=1 Tax=Pseudomonas putida TaxID=303 RepID=UPI0011982ED2|nr:hypothetical protein [Pseudomonas putida]QDY37616.1 hypothetical protein CHR26_15660 [Pseudomonas putida]
MKNTPNLQHAGKEAVRLFTKLYPTSITTFADSTQDVRAEGHDAQAILLGCAITRKRIAVVVQEGASDFLIGATYGEDRNNGTQVSLPLSALNAETLLDHMQKHFAKKR